MEISLNARKTKVAEKTSRDLFHLVTTKRLIFEFLTFLDFCYFLFLYIKMFLKLNFNCPLFNTKSIYEVMSVVYCLKLRKQRFCNKLQKCRISKMNMFWSQKMS